MSGGADYSQVKRYNAATQTFEPVADPVKPGEALWVKMLHAKEWVYPTPLARAAATFTYDGDGGRVQMTVSDGASLKTTTFIGSLYEVLPDGSSKSHIFLGPTRLATLERTPLLIARADRGSDPGSLTTASPSGSDPSGFRSSFSRALARADDFLTRAAPKKLRRALAAVEEFFVGRAYAATVLPSSLDLRFYHPDHLGSVNLITDHTGQQVELAEYSPFGSFSRKEVTPPPSTGGGQGEGASSPYFTGKRLDSATGLYYFGARYYDPQLGRFIQPDTIVQAPSDPQTLNRYTYCRNNPIIYTDPTGHSFWKKWGKIMRRWVAPIAAVAVFFISGGNIALAAATYSYYATTGANLERGRGPFESMGRGLLAAGATYAGASIGGAIGKPFGTFWQGFGTAVGAGAAGGASSAGLSGGDPLLGAAAGAAAGAVGGLLGGIGGNLKGLAAIARAGAVGSASGAASGAIFGDAGGGAWRGAASAAAMAIAVAIANGDFQRASDIGQKAHGPLGKTATEGKVVLEKSGHPFALRQTQTGNAATTDPGPFTGLKETVSLFAQVDHYLHAGLVFGAAELGGAIAVASGLALTVSVAPWVLNPLTTMAATPVAVAGVGVTAAGVYLMGKGPELASRVLGDEVH